MRFGEEELDKARNDQGLLNEEQVLRLPPRKASEARSLYGKVKVEVDNDGRRKVIDAVLTLTCDFNHVLADKTSVTAVCAVGGEFICGTEGCGGTCSFCRRPVCPDHRGPPIFSSVPDEEVCSRCRVRHLVSRLFGFIR